MEREFLEQLGSLTTNKELNKIIEEFVDCIAEEDLEIHNAKRHWKKQPLSLEQLAKLAEYEVADMRVTKIRKRFRKILQDHVNKLVLASSKIGKN